MCIKSSSGCECNIQAWEKMLCFFFLFFLSFLFIKRMLKINTNCEVKLRRSESKCYIKSGFFFITFLFVVCIYVCVCVCMFIENSGEKSKYKLHLNRGSIHCASGMNGVHISFTLSCSPAENMIVCMDKVTQSIDKA